MGQYYSQVELFFKQIPLFILPAEVLMNESGVVRNLLVEHRI